MARGYADELWPACCVRGEMNMTPIEILWSRQIGSRDVRWFQPPSGVNGAFPYVCAEDVVALLSPHGSAIASYVATVRATPEIGAVGILSEDGPLVIVPHEHARAILSVGVDIGSAPATALAEYLAGVESALYVYLAPMGEARIERWLEAFKASHGHRDEPEAA